MARRDLIESRAELNGGTQESERALCPILLCVLSPLITPSREDLPISLPKMQDGNDIWSKIAEPLVKIGAQLTRVCSLITTIKLIKLFQIGHCRTAAGLRILSCLRGSGKATSRGSTIAAVAGHSWLLWWSHRGGRSARIRHLVVKANLDQVHDVCGQTGTLRLGIALRAHDKVINISPIHPFLLWVPLALYPIVEVDIHGREIVRDRDADTLVAHLVSETILPGRLWNVELKAVERVHDKKV